VDLGLKSKVAMVAGASRGLGAAAAFPFSAQARYITGASLQVDGGLIRTLA